jgi:hypothetical protein
VALFITLFAMLSFTVLRIWRPGKSAKPLSDRIAWTVFAFGVYSMVFMAVYSMLSEGEGWGIRSWETIRLHKRLFFACAAVSVAGPLIVFLHQTHWREPEILVPPSEESQGVTQKS